MTRKGGLERGVIANKGYDKHTCMAPSSTEVGLDVEYLSFVGGVA